MKGPCLGPRGQINVVVTLARIAHLQFAPPNQSYMEQTMSVIVEDEPEAINAKLFSFQVCQNSEACLFAKKKGVLDTVERR